MQSSQQPETVDADQSLLRNVAPVGWMNPVPASTYDLVVIGAGTAGLVAAAGAAGLGARVALIEKHHLGGDCLNTGCVPSKAIISAAKRAAAARSAADFGVVVDPESVRSDFEAVMNRLKRLRSEISVNDSAFRFQKLGVDVFFGTAAFRANDHKVYVDDTALTFRRAVICTGAAPARPKFPGFDPQSVLTNESLFQLSKLPTRLIVIGGGPVGCEMAQAFQRLGSRVTLIDQSSRLLSRDDPSASRIVQDSMRRDGVQVLLNTTTRNIEHQGPVFRVTVTHTDVSEVIDADHVLYAAGRIPRTSGLGLEHAGVNYDASGIQVDDFLRTTNPDIYASGDVCSRFKFTHAADFLSRIVIQNALFWGRARASRLLIPWCTYTSPEVAHVGLLPDEADQRNIPIQMFEQSLADTDRAILDGETEGFVRVYVHRGTDRIAGATIVGAHAGDLISEVTLAMKHGIGLRKIASTIHPYPTQADALRRIGDQYNRTRLTPLALGFLNKLMRFQFKVRSWRK